MELKQILRGFYDRATLTAGYKDESGDVVEEVIVLHHTEINDAVWLQLQEIEKDDKNPVPVLTRQLLALDVYSPNITEDGSRVELTSEVLARLGEPFQRRMVDAITPNIRAPLAFGITAKDGEKKARKGSKGTAKSKAPTKDDAETVTG